MIKAALFDVDGTVLDSMSVWDVMGSNYVRSLGLTPAPDLDLRISQMNLDQGIDLLQKEYAPSMSTDEISKGLGLIIREYYMEHVTEKKGVREFLQMLQDNHIPMAVASLNDKQLIYDTFEKLDLNRYFIKLFSCSDFNTTKNSPLIYQKAAEYLGADYKDTMVFEDVLHAIMTAKNAGFMTCAVEDYFSRRDFDEMKRQATIYFNEGYDYSSFTEYFMQCN